MPTVVLFDVDGTLLTCGGAGRVAMEAAFREAVGRDDVCRFSFAGHTDRAIAREGLRGAGLEPDEAAIDAFLERYLGHLEPALDRSEGYSVFAGVTVLLDALEGRDGWAIGLGTGNVERGARAKLRRGGLDPRFGFGGFGCDHEERPRLIAAGAARGAQRLGVAPGRSRLLGRERPPERRRQRRGTPRRGLLHRQPLLNAADRPTLRGAPFGHAGRAFIETAHPAQEPSHE